MSRAISLRTSGSRKSFEATATVPSSPFVGADPTSSPHASAYGTLVRLIRLNGMARSDMAPLLGVRTQRAQNLAAVMTFSENQQTQLAAALRRSTIPACWNFSTWLPFSSPLSLFKEKWKFRYCPSCLDAGYHVNLHQLSWFERCPWHDTTLTTTCSVCGNEVYTGADWLMGRDMVCQCGHSLIDTSAAIEGTLAPPVGAEAFLGDYLAWAARERARAVLVAPSNGSAPMPSLAALIVPPRHWRPWVLSVRPFHARNWKNEGHTASEAFPTLSDLEVLRRDRPGFLRLSPSHALACAQVAAHLALKLPKETLSDGEMTLFLAGAGIEMPLFFEPARRPFSGEVSSMVPWQTSTGSFLNLACLHPVAYRPLVAILDAMTGTRTLVDFHAQAPAGELDLFLRCCRDILARGYAEGLRSVLAPHVSALWKMGRDRPHLTQPWLIVRRTGSVTTSIRAVWEPLGISMGQATEAIHEADDANRRRERYSRRSRRVK